MLVKRSEAHVLADVAASIEIASELANLLGIEGKVVGEDVAIREPQRQCSPQIRHRGVITVARVAEMVHPVKIVVHGMVNAVWPVELQKHRGNAEIIEKNSVVRTAADARIRQRCVLDR